MSDFNLAFSQDLAFELFNSGEQFPVDFDQAWVWLGYSNKANAKRFFATTRFKEGRDFSSLVMKNAQRGRPSDSIWLTIDAFKTWGMMAQTEQGDLIRDYFFECERIAKEKQAKLTPTEALLLQVQRMVEVEKELAAVKEEQKFHNVVLNHHHDRLKNLDQNVATQSDQIQSIEAEVGRYSNGVGNFYTILGLSLIHI